MVEVFITNIETSDRAARIQKALQLQFPGMEVNFDLEDCDRILRCESDHIDTEAIITFVKSFEILISLMP